MTQCIPTAASRCTTLFPTGSPARRSKRCGWPDRGSRRRRRARRQHIPFRPGTGNTRVVRRPLLLSGAIATGDGILAAQAMGADLAYMGSAFIATVEANAQQAYKRGHCRQHIGRYRQQQPVHGCPRQPAPSIVAAGMDPDNLPDGDISSMNFGSGAIPAPRPGRTSGAAARVSGRSRTCCPRRNWWRACSGIPGRQGRLLAA